MLSIFVKLKNKSLIMARGGGIAQPGNGLLWKTRGHVEKSQLWQCHQHRRGGDSLASRQAEQASSSFS